MITKVIVQSRSQFIKYWLPLDLEKEKINCISISEPGLDDLAIASDRFLNLHFDDIDPEDLQPENHPGFVRTFPGGPPRDLVLFTQYQAMAVKQFVSNAQARPEKETLVVHCAAGISRSGAVGSWVVEFLGLDYGEFKKGCPQICPNIWVMSLLRKEL